MKRSLTLLCFLIAPAFAGDWNPRLAADYLDSRQKDWFAWPRANQNAHPCISCHTNLTYLMARPALRKALGEKEPTQYETGFRDMLRSRLSGDDPKQLYPSASGDIALQEVNVEAIFAALFLPDSPQAFARLWKLQSANGSWPWNMANLDPWEMPESEYQGATYAAIAATREKGSAFGANVAALKKYVRGELAQQPLHNRLMALWAGSVMKDLLPKADSMKIVSDAYRVQEPDGGWTMASLGPFKEHPTAPVSEGSNAYATALTAYVLGRAGESRSDARLEKALAWLRSHQNPQTGAWEAPSMNKKYEPGSMQIRFMQDAATGFAVMALLDSK
jgi:squalene-hopene/tetraprenyl-beta-curcumene cyclase